MKNDQKTPDAGGTESRADWDKRVAKEAEALGFLPPGLNATHKEIAAWDKITWQIRHKHVMESLYELEKDASDAGEAEALSGEKLAELRRAIDSGCNLQRTTTEVLPSRSGRTTSIDMLSSNFDLDEAIATSKGRDRRALELAADFVHHMMQIEANDENGAPKAATDRDRLIAVLACKLLDFAEQEISRSDKPGELRTQYKMHDDNKLFACVTMADLENRDAERDVAIEKYGDGSNGLDLPKMLLMDARIETLVNRVKEIVQNYCGDEMALWYGTETSLGVKESVVQLVGINRSEGPEVLRTCHAYDLLYNHLAEIVGVM